jgi:tetratricopeptide (TPR) repeat protein
MFNAFHLEGVEAYKSGDYKKAKDLFLKAVEMDSNVPESHFFLAESCFLYDEENATAAKTEAITHLKNYIELRNNIRDAQLSNAYDRLGQCYEAINQYSKAVSYYEKAIEINPSSASALNNKGRLHMNLALSYLTVKEDCLSNFEQAEYCIKKILTICQNNPLLLLTLAQWQLCGCVTTVACTRKRNPRKNPQ